MKPSGYDTTGDFPKIYKDPDAGLPYTLEWSDWLSQLPGETIGTSVWTPEPGITVDSEAISGTKTQVVLSGGTEGSSYIVANKITLTPSGFTDTRRIEVAISKR